MVEPNGLAAMLSKVKTIAVVGAKDKPGRPVDRVGRYLIQSGFEVLPVHPKRTEVWGLSTYPSLLEIPQSVDVVNLFRASEHCPDHARECLRMDTLPKIFWMQIGISSPDARTLLSETPVVIVEDSCLMVEHQRLLRRRPA
jgi:uncharacterized protein